MLKQQGNLKRALKIGNSQKGFTKGIWCLPSLSTFCGEVLGSVAKWRAMNVCLKFSKAFYMLLQNTLVDSLRR